ncbi:Uncharacterized protein TCM_022794 [Theobroma cacao]|uniref:Uncharacterized protein n=1 Tax=Theobroma cacao TaxID=3641 RepID=A0A061F1J6_THECC|nr:Uncharacterized protein TCM_022794 [Theobroma cacao]
METIRDPSSSGSSQLISSRGQRNNLLQENMLLTYGDIEVELEKEAKLIGKFNFGEKGAEDNLLFEKNGRCEGRGKVDQEKCMGFSLIPHDGSTRPLDDSL